MASAVEMERLELRTQAPPAAVPGIRRAVVDFAELHGVGVGPDVALAVSEAITNAVLHAYREEQAGPMRVVACAEPDRLPGGALPRAGPARGRRARLRLRHEPEPRQPRARARTRRDRAAGHGAQHRAS